MTRSLVTPLSFGRDVLGPIVAEFCLRLWSLGSLMERQGDVALLFCARGGLRMQLAYEHFVASSRLSSPLHTAPLMVSRLVAIRPALMRSVREGLDTLLPSAASTLSYEFGRATLSEVALAMSGVAPLATDGTWDVRFTPEGFASLLAHRDGRPVVEALDQQAGFFGRHLDDALGGRGHAVLVDTGLYGTTLQVLAEGIPSIEFTSALIARSNYRRGPTRVAAHHVGVFGLSVQADGYSPLRRRTAMLRYWHFIEWLFEPELPSVRLFDEQSGVLRSNLEVDGWHERIEPQQDSAFFGVLEYIDALRGGPAERIVLDADRAWNEFRRAVVWPNRGHGHALLTGMRSYDFGKDVTWSAREWRGPVDALRGTSMWREGEIARSGTPLRLPLLAAIEAAYSARWVKQSISAWCGLA